MGLVFKAVIALSVAATAAQAQTVGTLFYFYPSLGACGFLNTSSQLVASVSNATFLNFPGATGNPNDNPICKHDVTVSLGDVSVTAQVVDYCPGCPPDYIGLSPAGFEEFAPLSQNTVDGVEWVID